MQCWVRTAATWRCSSHPWVPTPRWPPVDPQKANTLEDDGNMEHCALCTLGGSLLCCDGCPAAYHMRCLGEGPRSIPDGEWLCPECALGGRGEPRQPPIHH